MAQTYQQQDPLLSLVWAGDQGVAAAFKSNHVCVGHKTPFKTINLSLVFGFLLPRFPFAMLDAQNQVKCKKQRVDSEWSPKMQDLVVD